MNETFSNNLINGAIYHLLNFEKYTTFQQAAKQAAVNNNFQIVLFSADFNVVFSVETRHTVSIEDAVRTRLNRADFEKNMKGARLEVRGLETYWAPVDIAGTRYYLMLADNDKYYTQDEMTKLGEIMELAMGMWNYAPTRDPASEFIRALRRGNRGLAHTLLSEVGVRESELRGILVVSGARKDDAIKSLSEYEEKYAIRSIKIADADEIVGIFMGGESFSNISIECREELASRMDKCGAKKIFSAGSTSGIEGLCGSFSLINETEAFVQFIFPHKNVFTKFELALTSNCMNICMNSGNVKRSYLELIAPFKDVSDNKAKQLMETLEVFVLDAGMSSTRASQLMNVHVNTIQYRLKRIREILGADITESTIVPGLMMALAVQRIEKEAGPF